VDPLPPETIPTPMSNCLQGGFYFVSLGAGGTTAVPLPLSPATTPPHLLWAHDDTAASRVDPSSTSTTRRRRSQLLYRRSPQLRVSSDAGAVGKRHDGRQWVYPHPSDLWFTTRGLRVRVATGTGMGTGKPKNTHGLPMPLRNAN
jgi:hypothetical protein